MIANPMGRRVVGSLAYLLALLLVFPVHILALPQGGQVVSGQAQITRPDARNMAVSQASNKAVINWQQFSIARPEAVRFFQPSVSAVALNRVLGGDPSLIYGRLSANGSLFLINPNGVLVGPSGLIEANNFIASTLDMSNRDFLDGNYTFAREPGAPLSSILNQGLIQTSPGGSVSLLAPAVENQGTIVAKLGKVNLGAGEQATLSFAGNELIRFAVDAPVSGRVTASDGTVAEENSVNDGTITADGGEVVLTARSAFDAVKSVVNNTGLIEAKTLENRNGSIRLDGGDHGIVTNSGTLDVSGFRNGQTGGRVEVTGQSIGLAHYSKILASGSAGGGKVFVGGGYQGKDPQIRNGRITYVGKEAAVEADAVKEGDGGQVVVWSEEATRFGGTISARGGGVRGDGGEVEVSSKGWLDFNGSVDTTAISGQTGVLLLDPTNIYIALDQPSATAAGMTGADASVDGDDYSDDVFTASGAVQDSLLTTGKLLTALGTNNITVSTANAGGTGDGNITVVDDVAYSGGTARSLTLRADNDISLLADANITSSTATLDVTLNSDADGSGAGGITLNNGSSIESSGGDILLAGGIGGAGNAVDTYGITLTGADLVSAGGNIALRGAGRSGGWGIRINGGLLDSGAGDIVLRATSDTGDAIVLNNLTLQGSGALSLEPGNAGDTVGIAGGIGTFELSAADLDSIQDGFTRITIGRAADGAGAVDANAYAFSDPISLVGGSVSVTGISAGTDPVTVTARTGAITDGDGSTTTDVTGGTVTLRAVAGIGSTGAGIETDATSLDLTNAASGGIFINDVGTGGVDIVADAQTAGDIEVNTSSETLTLTGLSTAAGTITVAATGHSVVATSVAATDGAVSLTADGGLTATSVTTADSGSTGAYDITLSNGTGGDVSVGTLVSDSDVSITSAGAVTLAGTTDAASAVISSGAAINGGGTVTAASVDLDAAAGIGDTTPLNLSAASIDADTTNGDIDIVNAATAAATVNSLTTGTGAVDFAQTGDRSLAVTAAVTFDGTITIDNTGGDLTAGTLTAGGSGDISLRTTGTGAVIVGTGLTAAGDQVSIDAAGAVTLTGTTDAASAVISSGAAINGGGTVTAASVDLDAAAGIGDTTPLNLSAVSIDADTVDGDIGIVNAATAVAVVNSLSTGTGAVDFAQTGDRSLLLSAVAVSDGDITISNTGGVGADIDVDSVSADTADDTVAITAAGHIQESGDDAGSEVTGATLALASGDGGIGGLSGNALEIDAAVRFDADTSAVAGNALSVSDVAGDLPVGNVVLGVNDGTLVSAGAITDAYDGDDNLSSSGQVVLTAASGIGDSPPNGALEIRTVSLAAHAGGAGAIGISEADGVTLVDVDTAGGSIQIGAGGAITASDVRSNGGDTALTSTGGGMTLGTVSAGTGSLLLDAADAINGGGFSAGAVVLNAATAGLSSTVTADVNENSLVVNLSSKNSLGLSGIFGKGAALGALPPASNLSAPGSVIFQGLGTFLSGELAEIEGAIASLASASKEQEILDEMLRAAREAQYFMTAPLEIFIEMEEETDKREEQKEASVRFFRSRFPLTNMKPAGSRPTLLSDRPAAGGDAKRISRFESGQALAGSVAALMR